MAEIFQTLARSMATGVLRLMTAERSCDVVFDDGTIIQVHTRLNRSSTSIASRLHAMGASLPQSAFHEDSSGNHRTIGDLVEQGSVQPDEIRGCLRQSNEGELYDLFTWDRANFVFLEYANGEEEVVPIVDEARKMPVPIPANHVLMESARRLDEWNQVRDQLPHENVVFAPAAGQEEALQQEATSYPGNAVIPLIDGVRNMDELIETSPATRIEVYGVIGSLFDRRMITPLDRKRLIERARQFADLGDQYAAARLYRQALAEDPEDHDLIQALANTLEEAGDGPQAMSCYLQLSHGYLNAGDVPSALWAARRAAAITPDAMEARHHLLECLSRAGEAEEWVDEARKLAERLSEEGFWDEARDLCQQLLQQEPDDIIGLHVLANSCNHTDDQDLGDHEVACISCGTINQRSANQCVGCKAQLHLPCRTCTREVAVSDRVCIYCGHDPHRAPGSPDIAHEDYEGVNEEFQSAIRRAVQYQQERSFEQALAVWKDVAEDHPDHPLITRQIRDLQALVHSESIERMIESGNHLHRRRRYLGASSAYKHALRGLNPRDPRRQRLEYMLASARQNHRRATVIYAVAGLILLAAGFLAVEPLIVLQGFRGEVRSWEQQVAELRARGGGAATQRALQEIQAQAQARAQEIGERGEFAAQSLLVEINAARPQLAEEQIEHIESALAADNPQQAREAWRQYRDVFGNTPPGPLAELDAAITTMEQAKEERAALLASAPERWQETQAAQADGRWQAALTMARALASLEGTDVAAPAAAMVAELEAAKKRFDTAWEQSAAIIDEDLQAARQGVAELEEDAGRWQRQAAWQQRQEHIARLIAEAEEAYQRFADEPTISGAEAFLSKHEASARAAAVRQELQRLQRQGEQRQQLLTKIKTAEEQQDWAALHTAISDYRRRFPDQSPPQPLQLPLRVTSDPSEAEVLVAGEVVGRTPYVVRYDPATEGRVEVRRAGFQTASAPLQELTRTSAWSPTLPRAERWREEFGWQVRRLWSPFAGRLLLAGDDQVVDLDVQSGTLHWRQNGVNEAAVTDWPWQVGMTDDGTLLMPAGERLVVVAADGTQQAAIPLRGPVMDRPIRYENAIFSAGARYGVITRSGLEIATSRDSTHLAPLASQPIAGPLVFGADIEALLLVANLNGELVAYNEVDQRVEWRLATGATDITALQSIAEDRVVTMLDGSRLGAFAFDGEGARRLWEHDPGDRVRLRPRVCQGVTVFATDRQIVSITPEGAATALDTEEPATAVTRDGDVLVWGTGKGILHVREASRTLWVARLPGEVVAVALLDDTVVAATGNGTVVAYDLR